MMPTTLPTTHFAGRFRISGRGIEPFPTPGTPVTIEEQPRGAEIVIGDAKDPRCRRLRGRFDAKTRTLKGRYDGRYSFELVLKGRSARRHLLCTLEPINGHPESSTWEADEDGP